MFEPLSGPRIGECPFDIYFLDKLGFEHNLIYGYGGIAGLQFLVPFEHFRDDVGSDFELALRLVLG